MTQCGRCPAVGSDVLVTDWGFGIVMALCPPCRGVDVVEDVVLAREEVIARKYEASFSGERRLMAPNAGGPTGRPRRCS